MGNVVLPFFDDSSNMANYINDDMCINFSDNIDCVGFGKKICSFLEHYKNNNSDIVSFCKDNFLNFDLMCGDCPQRIFGVIYEHFIN
jgi:hypothetical protein